MFISNPSRDQVIALAGIFQACQLVETLAKTGSIPGDSLETCLQSIFVQDPKSMDDIFHVEQLRLGIEAMHELLTIERNSHGSDTLRYVIGVSHLQGKLLNSKKILNALGQGIERIHKQAEHFSVTHENVVASLADLYQQTISTFNYRIQVNGFANYLQQNTVANRIRSLLLAAVRSAVLWRQLGGSRLHLIFKRKAILKQLNEIQRELH